MTLPAITNPRATFPHAVCPDCGYADGWTWAPWHDEPPWCCIFCGKRSSNPNEFDPAAQVQPTQPGEIPDVDPMLAVARNFSDVHLRPDYVVRVCGAGMRRALRILEQLEREGRVVSLPRPKYAGVK